MTMTDEELDAMEIDWTQGVAENFERVKSAARAAIDAANRRAEEAEARMYSSQRIAIAAEAEIDTLRARVAELEAGGCARDQGTTQYCAEAVALQKRVAELERAIKTIALHAPSLDTIGIRGLCDEVMLPDTALKDKEPGNDAG